MSYTDSCTTNDYNEAEDEDEWEYEYVYETESDYETDTDDESPQKGPDNGKLQDKEGCTDVEKPRLPSFITEPEPCTFHEDPKTWISWMEEQVNKERERTAMAEWRE